MEQQEARNRNLTYQLYSYKEHINEIEMDIKLSRQDHINRVNEYYDQANHYYENFRQLEQEMSTISENNESTLAQSFGIIE